MDGEQTKMGYDFSALIDFAKLQRVVLRDLSQNRQSTSALTKYTKAQLQTFLQNPESNEKQLREASRYLYMVSSHYRRLVNYFAKLHTLSYILIPYKLDTAEVNADAFRASYVKSSDTLQTMNLRHELQKILVISFREDVFYGYIYQAKDSFYIRPMPSDYCKISSVSDGCFIYSFDFSYFQLHNEELSQYGEEFEQKYKLYQENNTTMRWQEIDEPHCFCVKVNEDISYPCIPFSGVFDGIYDIEDYKGLQKARTEIGNYKALSLKIPIDNGDLSLPEPLVQDYYKKLCAVLPDYVGAFLTPMDVDVHSFEKSGAADENSVSDAQKEFWNDAGISSLLFGGDSQTSASLNTSIRADEQIVFSFMRQIERNVNKILKLLSGAYKFKTLFLDVSYFNQREMHDLYLKDAQASLPTKSMVCATLGMSPADIAAMSFLETDILHMQDYVPLSTSYTQSGEAGRPSNADSGKQLTDSGEQTQDDDENANRR